MESVVHVETVLAKACNVLHYSLSTYSLFTIMPTLNVNSQIIVFYDNCVGKPVQSGSG